jgi:threonine dehydratase
LLGIATYWLELFTAVPEVDVAYVPIGMGSGVCSGAAVRNGLGLKTKLVGVVSDRAPTYALSIEQRRIVEAPALTVLADGLACRKGKRVALIATGGNVDHDVFARVLGENCGRA